VVRFDDLDDQSNKLVGVKNSPPFWPSAIANFPRKLLVNLPEASPSIVIGIDEKFLRREIRGLVQTLYVFEDVLRSRSQTSISLSVVYRLTQCPSSGRFRRVANLAFSGRKEHPCA